MQMDVPGVLQPLQSADEAKGRSRRQEVDLQECSREASGGQRDGFLLNLHKF